MAAGRRLFRLPSLSLLDIAFLALPVWLLAIVSHTAADADLWGHLRFGADFLERGTLPVRDSYSFTSDVPWINHEWLSEAVMAVAYAAGGAAGLIAMKVLVIGAIAWLAWRAASPAATPPTLNARIAVTTLVVFASYTRTQVLRPQLFSVLLFAVLMHLLERSHRTTALARRRALEWVALPLLFCVWSNLHGAWIVGFAALCAWCAGDVLSDVGRRRTERSTAIFEAAVSRSVTAALALCATLVNPYGVGQWRFLRETVGPSRSGITDWIPFWELPAPIIALDLVLPALATAALLLRRRRPALRHAAVCAVLAFATLKIGRVDAFLAVAIGMLLGSEIAALFDRLTSHVPTGRLTRRSTLNGLAAAALVAIATISAAARATTITIEGSWVPDQAAARMLKVEAPGTRLLTWFDWGEYAIWHLAPAGIRISMDGRRETVYSDRVLADHWAFYFNLRDDAWTYPDAIGADLVWVPRRLPIGEVLRGHGWHALYESEASIVLSRQPPPPRVASSSHVAAPFFPGE